MNRTKTLNQNPLFYSKILLFGEYGVIKDSKGLSIPYNFYNGLLKIDNQPNSIAKNSNTDLKNFFKYLKALSEKEKNLLNLDLKSFKEDLESDMYFDSSIPKGYGVGSSGALVAAVYDKYTTQEKDLSSQLNHKHLRQLKRIFSIMESYFHGNSSGLDPLNSYLSLPILIDSENNLQTIGLPKENKKSKSAIFLLDSGIIGKTSAMVSIFSDKMKHTAFQKMLKEEFIKHTENCIEDFIKADFNSLFSNIKHLSRVALENFKPMIPSKIQTLWQYGIKQNSYYLKLCGSGGGGYVLGFTQDLEKTKKELKDYKLEVVYHF